ncbi:hypothetical protein [Microcoleus sp. bin38.metabat.b11b12b14.051]|uniref:hypothetical protein n=1 Tax=Microcoleus sp. bin38.metabat.b11b12b14.051 TaxID=2742709 RepID=UPI0025EE1FA5|nr:hypothetical protein [Microcoleus sp. bin38.metabat.b11b12b14.051]
MCRRGFNRRLNRCYNCDRSTVRKLSLQPTEVGFVCVDAVSTAVSTDVTIAIDRLLEN